MIKYIFLSFLILCFSVNASDPNEEPPKPSWMMEEGDTHTTTEAEQNMTQQERDAALAQRLQDQYNAEAALESSDEEEESGSEYETGSEDESTASGTESEYETDSDEEESGSESYSSEEETDSEDDEEYQQQLQEALERSRVIK